MIIPVKCFTCGTVLADKYRYYQDKVRAKKLANGDDIEKVIYLTKEKVEKTKLILTILQLIETVLTAQSERSK